MPHPDPGTQRLATDRGLTGDKIPVSDPAAAPLQTDSEAAGIPISRSEACATTRDQAAIARGHPRPDTFGSHGHPFATAHQRSYWPMLALVIVMVLLGLLLGWWGLR